MSVSTNETFITNIQNIAYNILKYVGDNLIQDRVTPAEPSHCPE